MKRIICILLSLIMIFLLVGCNQVDTMVESYQIKFIDENNLIYDLPENRICVPNTVFTFHAYPITDADLAMYVNGEKKCIQTNIETDDGYIWEYTFKMISEPVEIEFKIKNKHNLKDNDIFFPSEASALNKERFIASFKEMLGEKANEMEYEVLSNYVPQEKSELYNFDAFSVEMNDEIHFYAWLNDKIYNLANLGNINNNNYHFLHFCVSDINNDGYLEISTSVNFNRTSKNPFSYTNLAIIDEYSEKIVFYSTYNAFAYFKEDQDGVIGVYISDTITYDDGSYDESNTLLTKLLPNDYKFTFKKKEYNCSSDNYDALITIDDNTAYFPVLSDCGRIGFKVNVDMTYLGESFSYVNPTDYLDGATCTFINGEDKIICEGWGETCVVTTFSVFTGMEIDRTYFYPYNLSNQLKKGTYDMVISYRGESVVIEDFLTIE